MTQDEYSEILASARDQFKAGKPLLGRKEPFIRISNETISNITVKVWDEIKAWRNRTLDEVCPVVWMDAIHYKVGNDKGAAKSRAIYKCYRY